ncbi:MAG: NlpC/P60 family protein [Actinophytocola sp.]|nr:NlpC/P60 family protein [Actinophytocola sp.]
MPAKIARSADWRLSYDGDTVHDGDSSATKHVTAAQPVNERIVETAAAQEGEPYEYGANGPDSFDCSGLTQYVHNRLGIELPRTSSDQRESTRYVSAAEKKPGDLIFFDDGGDVYHVAVYAGDNKVWTAPQERESVQLENIWDDDYTVGRAW